MCVWWEGSRLEFWPGLGWRVRADLVIDRGRGWRLETQHQHHYRGPVAPGHCSVLSSPAANGHSIAIFRASGHVTSFHTPDPPHPATSAQCYTSLLCPTSLYSPQQSLVKSAAMHYKSSGTNHVHISQQWWIQGTIGDWIHWIKHCIFWYINCNATANIADLLYWTLTLSWFLPAPVLCWLVSVILKVTGI